MPKCKLTDAFVKNAPPIGGKLTEYLDEKERGLALRVTPAGVRAYAYRYRNKAGQQRRVTLGKIDEISLADARALLVRHRATVSAGGDPAAIAAADKQAAIDEMNRETVADVGAWYFREAEAGRHRPNLKRRKRQSTIDLERYYLDRHIVPTLGARKLTDLTRSNLQAFIDDLADNHALSTARQCRIIMHAIYAFAMRHEIVSGNPLQFVTVGASNARETVISDADLRAIWNALTPPIDIDGAAISANVACSVLLAMVTLQRRAEITGMRLAELDRERRLWVIPSSRTKNHRTHAVPLSDLALELIDRALSVRAHESAFVFPSPRDPGKPINPEAMTRAFGRMKAALDLGDIRPHDLRRTGATNLTGESLGFPRFVVSKVLNHASDAGGGAAVTAIYDQNEYLSEKRRALNAWASRLFEIVSGREMPSNVLTLERG